MTDRPSGAPQPDQNRSDDPTRDIRLLPPPLQEQSVQKLSAQAPAEQRTADAAPAADPDPTVVVRPVGGPGESRAVREQSTDEMAPTAVPPREDTRPFVAPREEVPRERVPAGAAPPREDGGRAWPWVLLVLLPIVIIAATGLLLVLLLGGR
jgi:hypothetical protein